MAKITENFRIQQENIQKYLTPRRPVVTFEDFDSKQNAEKNRFISIQLLVVKSGAFEVMAPLSQCQKFTLKVFYDAR
jgi:glycyl-tRNA synthetase beta subunit